MAAFDSFVDVGNICTMNKCMNVRCDYIDIESFKIIIK